MDAVLTLPPAPNGKGLVIDVDSREVLLDGRHLALTRSEFDLLALLSRNPRRVMTPRAILLELWDTDFVGDDRPVEVYVHRLRRKLGESGKANAFIHTVRGVGYRFEPDPPSSTLPTKLLYDSSGVLQLVVTDSDELLGWPVWDVVGTRYIPSVARLWAQPWVRRALNKLASNAGLESFNVAPVIVDSWGNTRRVRAKVRFIIHEGVTQGVEVIYAEVDN